MVYRILGFWSGGLLRDLGVEGTEIQKGILKVTGLDSDGFG
jgi:hypothetical protein